MPRRARLALAGVAWHIIQRGNNRTACFFADEDYRQLNRGLSPIITHRRGRKPKESKRA